MSLKSKCCQAKVLLHLEFDSEGNGHDVDICSNCGKPCTTHEVKEERNLCDTCEAPKFQDCFKVKNTTQCKSYVKGKPLPESWPKVKEGILEEFDNNSLSRWTYPVGATKWSEVRYFMATALDQSYQKGLEEGKNHGK